MGSWPPGLKAGPVMLSTETNADREQGSPLYVSQSVLTADNVCHVCPWQFTPLVEAGCMDGCGRAVRTLASVRQQPC